MTNEAAFKAVYSDFKLVKTRGVVQIILEVPIEQSSPALEALGGMPSQAEAMWCGVARLSQQGAAQPQPVTPTIHPTPAGAVAKRPWEELSPREQACIRCSDPIFQAFLSESRFDEYCVFLRRGYSKEESAACLVRKLCNVASRSDLASPKAKWHWDDLQTEFADWRLRDKVSA